ncbi:glycosyltransferase family 9 protein [Cerasicoccus frondis]|uniref:glycosyltransferase family 9 protein n=1 Tax=Cerasicoccus frondis TaxID=490090 RepID=UPI00285252C8|nr:glycosyltransferase family 9 protein [Cerasicoccus frondis]
MTHALQAAINAGDDVTVLTKPASRALLEPTFPTIRWVELTAPWTAHRGKYRLWQWNWRQLASTIRRLRALRIDDAFSARPDPRDHLLMWLIGAKHRRSYQHAWGKPFLNAGLDWPNEARHRAEDWRALAASAGLTPTERPNLPADAYAESLPAALKNLPRPWVLLHTGAAQPTRRWPEEHWRRVIAELRGQSEFSLILMPDPTGHGEGLKPIANVTLDSVSLPTLAATLAAADAVLAHDSGPMHIAAAFGTPVFAIMGPNLPVRFGPCHPDAAFLHDPQCPHFPCKDYCHFEEPRCITHFSAERCLETLIPWLEMRLENGRAMLRHRRSTPPVPGVGDDGASPSTHQRP